jgi:hypothetical protein
MYELKMISVALSEIYYYAEKGFTDHVLLFAGSNKAHLDRIIKQLEEEK